ncbi:LOB domain-containing protein 36-like [Senna tora]|uniref:LOB domain-containing protein 36-like n=1 Tax=Senna tora TaxID=362788 RepID=A0A834TV08_9FABA|nr:LOB domain-containing protein 36-like [Senna tora]
MSSSNSPCAACKFLRRKCTQECVYAPYFPPDNPQRFAYVHKVFGASNVAKLLNELNAAQRDDAVKSLAYEAEARLRDPVYGCVGLISILQHRLRQIQVELNNAKKELATYIGPQALQPMPPTILTPGVLPQQHPGNPYSSTAYSYNNMPPPPPMANIPTGASSHSGQLLIRDPQQQHQHPSQQHQILDAQQLAVAVAAREQQDMFRGYEQQQQQQEFMRFNSGYEVGSVSGNGFNNQISTAAAPSEIDMSPSLALGSFDSPYQMQPQHQLQAQLMLSPQQPQPQQQTQQSQQPHPQQSESEEARSGIDLSCEFCEVEKKRIIVAALASSSSPFSHVRDPIPDARAPWTVMYSTACMSSTSSAICGVNGCKFSSKDFKAGAGMATSIIDTIFCRPCPDNICMTPLTSTAPEIEHAFEVGPTGAIRKGRLMECRAAAYTALE